jgi:hypothetical protein
LLKKDVPEAEKTPKAAGASEPVNGSDQRSKKNEQKKKDGKKVKAAF